MTLLEVQEMIEKLSQDDQAALAVWLERRDPVLWDRQITRDFFRAATGRRGWSSPMIEEAVAPAKERSDQGSSHTHRELLAGR